MSLRVLAAPSGFKERLGAEEVADCIEAGAFRAVAPGEYQILVSNSRVEILISPIELRP
jgi:glycerate kinase